MSLDFEYCLFTTEDPIEKLKAEAKNLPIHKKFKISPYIRRSSALVDKSNKFRKLITDDNNYNNMLVGYSFASYFGEKLDKHQFLAIPRDVSYDFIRYVNSNPMTEDDKYMKRLNSLILSHSDGIDAFVKAFLSIRLAQGELDKLK